MQSSATATATATASMVGSWPMSASASAVVTVTPGSLVRAVDLGGDVEMYFSMTASLQSLIPVVIPPYPVKKLRRVSPVFTVSPE